jgi:hypothetical protein
MQLVLKMMHAHPPVPAGRKFTYTRYFLFHWPKELSKIGSSISLSGNMHPQITSGNSPLILWEIGLRTFTNPDAKIMRLHPTKI